MHNGIDDGLGHNFLRNDSQDLVALPSHQFNALSRREK